MALGWLAVIVRQAVARMLGLSMGSRPQVGIFSRYGLLAAGVPYRRILFVISHFTERGQA